MDTGARVSFADVERQVKVKRNDIFFPMINVRSVCEKLEFQSFNRLRGELEEYLNEIDGAVNDESQIDTDEYEESIDSDEEASDVFDEMLEPRVGVLVSKLIQKFESPVSEPIQD